jgi:hypothetical protein
MLHNINHKRGRALALLASVLACAGFADRAFGAGGNATNAKLCQQGGWSKRHPGAHREEQLRVPVRGGQRVLGERVGHVGGVADLPECAGHPGQLRDGRADIRLPVS